MLQRARSLNTYVEHQSGPVVYWMNRDQRAHDNWALLYAAQLAEQNQTEVVVVFNLVPTFLGATWRQYGFMLKGLKEVAETLKEKNIPFFVLVGDPEKTIVEFIKKHSVGTLVTDFTPLKIGRAWRKNVAELITVPFFEVDAHNIVPCWIASPKLEFAARTIRPKITRLLPEFLTDFPVLKKQVGTKKYSDAHTAWSEIKNSLKINFDVGEVDWITPGEHAAYVMLDTFITKKAALYNEGRNDPNSNAQSNLSPYLHFGHLSAQRVVLEIQKRISSPQDKEAFLEELIIRRELADNFCFYNQNYDLFIGFPAWAQKTLNAHRSDKREYIYTQKQFEQAQTHDQLWNAAQQELLQTGKMHGYLRMYWAKKILEWTSTPEEALAYAIYLNDTYELDGRDPNGYTGIAWSIGGVHDRAWFTRPIFGTIRYMNANGAKNKFDVKKYCDTFL